jgi:hypothetical protein
MTLFATCRLPSGSLPMVQGMLARMILCMFKTMLQVMRQNMVCYGGHHHGSGHDLAA